MHYLCCYFVKGDHLMRIAIVSCVIISRKFSRLFAFKNFRDLPDYHCNTYNDYSYYFEELIFEAAVKLEKTMKCLVLEISH